MNACTCIYKYVHTSFSVQRKERISDKQKNWRRPTARWLLYIPNMHTYIHTYIHHSQYEEESAFLRNEELARLNNATSAKGALMKACTYIHMCVYDIHDVCVYHMCVCVCFWHDLVHACTHVLVHLCMY